MATLIRRDEAGRPGGGPPLIDAVRLLGAGAPNAAQSHAGQVTYRVMEAPPAAQAGEKRAGGRIRTRLRSGKLLDAQNRFLADCLLHDRSPRGSRLRLYADVALPATLRFYDDECADIVEAMVVWRRGADVGLRTGARVPARLVGQATLARLGGRYYAAVGKKVPFKSR